MAEYLDLVQYLNANIMLSWSACQITSRFITLKWFLITEEYIEIEDNYYVICIQITNIAKLKSIRAADEIV